MYKPVRTSNSMGSWLVIGLVIMIYFGLIWLIIGWTNYGLFVGLQFVLAVVTFGTIMWGLLTCLIYERLLGLLPTVTFILVSTLYGLATGSGHFPDLI